MKVYPTVFGLALALTLSCCQYGPYAQPSPNAAPGPQVVKKSPEIMREYDSFFIADIKVYSVQGDALRRVDDREVRNLAEEFRAKLIRSLGNRHSPIPQPARNTASITIALTDVATTYAAFQLLPGAIIPNAMRGGASIEATVKDSISGEPVATFKDSRQGARQGFLSGLGKWDGVQKAFDEWADQLAGALRP
jgi:hypothetical protein